MECVLIALVCMMVGVTAHHLGLTEEAAKIVSKIAECPKCCTFWISLFVLTIKGCDLFVSVVMSLFMAYLSFYFGLALVVLQKLYDWIWKIINR